jgi:site-specific recombinase XerD
MNSEELKVPPSEGFREAFKDYLIARRFMQSTINGHLLNVGYFIKWIENNGLHEAENLQYTDLLNYVNYEQKQNKDVSTINLRLNSITKYFDFLKCEGLKLPPSEGVREARNPARTLRIKGKAKTIIQNPLKYDELLSLYNGYKSIEKAVPNHIKEKSELAHQRNIIITGLLIWQGLHSGELEKLEVNHVNLNDGIIYVPSTTRSNSRELKLSSQQIITLHTYIHGGVRDKFKVNDEKLFAGNLHNTLQLLIEELKGINPQIKNAQHIRASVILYWLRQHNKRQVQYMAGHKYIHSTEAYEVQELETLTDQLTKHHPFG